MVITSVTLEKPTFLQLIVNIDEPVKIWPEFALWRVGEQAAKTIHISVSENVSTKILSVTSDNAAIRVELTEVKPGKEYELHVIPTDVTKSTGATLMIRTADREHPAPAKGHYGLRTIRTRKLISGRVRIDL